MIDDSFIQETAQTTDERVTLDLDPQVQYWTQKFDTSHYALREVIAEVGPMAKDVAAALKARARLYRQARRRRTSSSRY